MQKRWRAGLSVLLSASLLYSAVPGGLSAAAAPEAPARAYTAAAEEPAEGAETTALTAETTGITTETTAQTTEITALTTDTGDTGTSAETSSFFTQTTETSTETTTVTAAAPLPDPVFTADFDEGYPTGDTVLHLRLSGHTGIKAIGISVTLPEILAADAEEGDVCTFTLSDAFQTDNLFSYYNAQTHVLSVACAGMNAASAEEELGSIRLHIAEEAESGQAYPVTLLLSSLALADGREYAQITETVDFIPAETPLRTLSETELTVSTIGEPMQLTLTPEPPAGSCTWESSNPETVSVTEDGQICCLQEGYAEITVSCEKRTYTCKVTVRFDRMLNCEVIHASDDGDTLQLALEPAPEVVLNWESSDPSILSIDENGLATAHRNGEVTIQITSEYFEYAFPVRVVIPRSMIETEYVFQERGEQLQLKLVPAPLDEIQWSSDDPEIAEVAEDGTVTPKKNGSTVIHAVCEEQEYTCNISVKFPYALNFSDYAVREAGEGVSLALLPKEEGMPDAVWQSSDPTVAEVDENGNVTVLRKGEAIIYCIAGGRTYTCHVSLLPYTRGDVDQNGEIDVGDAQLTLQYYTEVLAKKPGALTAQQRLAADVTEDGIVSLDDAMVILQYVTDVLSRKSPTWEEVIARMTPES